MIPKKKLQFYEETFKQVLRKKQEKEVINDLENSQFEHIICSISLIQLQEWSSVILKTLDKKKKKEDENKGGWFGWFGSKTDESQSDDDFSLTEEEIENMQNLIEEISI